MRPFRPLRRLGHGAMAEVHLAELQLPGETKQKVALKRIKPALRFDVEVRRRFEEEADIGMLLRHPHIVEVVAADTTSDEPWIAMELLEGPNLQEVIDKLGGTPAPPGFAFAAGHALAAALAYAHQAHDHEGQRIEIIHRDVSPKNVLWGADGKLRLIDFGLARGARPRRTNTGVILGDASYLSPEQSRGEFSDTRSDVFSAALVIYVLATGVHPFQANHVLEQLKRVDRCKVKIPELLGVHVPDALVRVMLRALSREPKDRYRHGGEFLEALDRAAPEIECREHTDVLRFLSGLGFEFENDEADEVTMTQHHTVDTATEESKSDGTLADLRRMPEDGTLADSSTGTLQQFSSDSESSDWVTLKDLRQRDALRKEED